MRADPSTSSKNEICQKMTLSHAQPFREALCFVRSFSPLCGSLALTFLMGVNGASSLTQVYLRARAQDRAQNEKSLHQLKSDSSNLQEVTGGFPECFAKAAGGDYRKDEGEEVMRPTAGSRGSQVLHGVLRSKKGVAGGRVSGMKPGCLVCIGLWWQ